MKKTKKAVKRQILKLLLLLILVAIIGYTSKHEKEKVILKTVTKTVTKVVYAATTTTPIKPEKSLKMYDRTDVVSKIFKEGNKRDYSREEIDRLVRLSVCESGLNQFFLLHNQDKKRSIDRGIYAINDKWHPDIPNETAFDVDFSIKFTFNAYEKGRMDMWYCWEKVLKNPENYNYSNYVK